MSLRTAVHVSGVEGLFSHGNDRAPRSPGPPNKQKTKLQELLRRNRSGLTHLQQIAVEQILNHEPLQKALLGLLGYRLANFVRRRGRKAQRRFEVELRQRSVHTRQIFGALSSIGGAIGDFVSNTANKALDATKSLGSQLGKAAKGAWNAAKRGVMAAIEGAVEGIEGTIDQLENLLEGLDPSKILESVMRAFRDAANSVANSIKDGVLRAVDGITDPSWLHAIRDVLMSAINAVANTAKKVVGGVKDAFKKVGAAVETTVKKVVSVLRETLAEVGDFFQDTVEDIRDGVAEFGSKVVWAAKGAASRIQEKTSNALKGALGGVKDAAESVGDKIGDLAESVAGRVMDAANGIKNSTESAAQKAVDGITDLAEDAGDGIASIGSTVLRTANNIAEQFQDIGESIWGAVNQALSYFEKLPQKVFKFLKNDLFGFLKDAFAELFSKLFPNSSMLTSVFKYGFFVLIGVLALGPIIFGIKRLVRFIKKQKSNQP